MKKLSLVFITLLFVLAVHSQTEVYFSRDTLKVKSLQGASVETNNFWELGRSSSFNSLLEASYFYELRLADRVSLFMDAGLNTSFRKSGSVTVPMFSQLGIFMGVEPRYYLSLSQRKSALRGGLNSGWYVGVPLRALTDVIPESYYIYDGQTYDFVDSHFKLGEYIKYSAGFNIGYRHALTNKLFIEGAVGGAYQTYNFKYGNFYLNGVLKLAYTF